MKRIFSLLVLFTFYWTLTAQAVGSDAMLPAGTYKSGPSHIGIMLDDEFFIHAGGEMLQINSIHDPMWRPYFLGYKSL